MKRKIKHNLKEFFVVSTNETITIIKQFNDGEFCSFFIGLFHGNLWLFKQPWNIDLQ